MVVGVSTLAQALNQVDRIKGLQNQFDDLAIQMSSGKKTQVFSGLGVDVLISKKSRAEFGKLDAFTNSIKNATRRINLTVGAIEEYKVQANSFYGALSLFAQESAHQKGDIFYYDDPTTLGVVEQDPIGMTSEVPDIEFGALIGLANNLYDVMVNIINAKDGERYLMAGAAIFTEPLTNSGLMDGKMNQLITDWKAETLSTDSLISALQNSDPAVDTNAVTDTIAGYSSVLSAGNADNVFVTPDDNTQLDYTTLGNDQAFRDVLVGLAFLKNPNLPPIADVYLPGNAGPPSAPDFDGAPGVNLGEMKDNFFRVFNAVIVMVNNAVDRLDTLRFDIENVKARIDDIKNSHVESQRLLEVTIGEVEDPDINEVAVKLSNLEIQLDASFRITARLQDLSLVNFI